MNKPARQHRSISIRLTVATLVFSLLATSGVTAIALVSGYHHLVANAQRGMDDIGVSFVPTLSASLRLMDPDRVEMLLDGISRMPGVACVELDSEGQHSSRGHVVDQPLLQRSFALSDDHGGHFELGTLRVEFDRAPVMATLVQEGITVTLISLATLLAASLSLLWLFRTWVTQHLVSMAKYARHMTLNQLKTPLELTRPPSRLPDELDDVVASFNRMREHILDELEVRERHEQELEGHRERLETLVRARTATLEEQTLLLEQQKLDMQLLVNTDSLTGVSSRRYFLERVAMEILRSRRLWQPVSLLMLDIDHFKRINDGHGHAVGDRALVLVAECCKSILREVDAVGRLGGEEFAILLPQADALSAGAVAERLRVAVEKICVVLDSGQTIACTVSIGVSELAEKLDSPDALLARADAALYEAKRAGRNQVHVSPDLRDPEKHLPVSDPMPG